METTSSNTIETEVISYSKDMSFHAIDRQSHRDREPDA